MKTRLAIITNILPPYRVPLFNSIEKKRNIELKVFLSAKSEPNRHWEWPQNIEFEYEIVKSFKCSPSHRKTIYFNFKLIERIKKFKPDVIICGGMGILSLIGWICSQLNRARFFLWGEGIIGADGLVGLIMFPIRWFLVRISDGIIASSKSSADFFRAYGGNPEKIKISLITFDTIQFAQKVEKYRTIRNNILQDFGFKSPVILYVGQLERYKGVDLLLKTFEYLLKILPSAELVIIGTGSKSSELQKQVKIDFNSKVHFVGSKQPNELSQYYAIADLFTLFSRSEPFGLVVTEAVVAGLPILCSKYAGAAYDLVENGRNGFIVDPKNIKTNAVLMKNILSDNNLCLKMGRRSKQIAKKFTIDEAADLMLNTVKSLADSFRT